MKTTTISRKKSNRRFAYSALVILLAIAIFALCTHFVLIDNPKGDSRIGVAFILILAGTMATIGHINEWD